ncbi:pyridoxamine 5'-phosphate oxidase family protein [Ornithinimicrobium cryptoxanthini]|uniref:Pyridoxamine 5'-phosphate oxidase family protein n=1 Tax=Ornithinimicrobium cryptoxanthini TaxID=2934161 RepID=A0ABY4YJ22_9MICO|nr:pyridoxamine 5'-phosphate oxidase family protein [Ornithinimicrobium cryptoxanthini]USQ76622.1 pyridoxamine 5'-phosphate oxidase family protein [Ornithinimicrobium cryptoxanthini]
MEPEQSVSPYVGRPEMPEGYGVPETSEGLLSWAEIETRLERAKHYWLSSVRPDGTPHSVPRWGVWLEGRFWYDGAPTTRHTRNVEQNPAVTLTLESGTEAVIVEGGSVATRAEADGLGARLAEAFGKYHDLDYSPGPDSWSGEDGGGLRVITPRRVLAWFDFPKDVTRFKFAGVEANGTPDG